MEEIALETTKYIINIDKHIDSAKRTELLHSEGGYLLTYAGENKGEEG